MYSIVVTVFLIIAVFSYRNVKKQLRDSEERNELLRNGFDESSFVLSSANQDLSQQLSYSEQKYLSLSADYLKKRKEVQMLQRALSSRPPVIRVNIKKLRK